MTNKIVAIQGNHPSKLNPKTDTSIFLANEIQKKKYRVFYYDPKDLSIIDAKVIAKGFFIKFNYKDKKFYKIQKKQKLDLIKCKFILIINNSKQRMLKLLRTCECHLVSTTSFDTWRHVQFKGREMQKKLRPT